MTRNGSGPYLDCDCGEEHPRGCRGHVEECTVCQWRGDNHVDQPCTSCAGGPVISRPCRRSPSTGQLVCTSHGAKSPQAIARAEHDAEVERIDGQVAQLLERYHIPDEHPLEGLLAAVGKLGAIVRALESMVRELDLHPIVNVEIVKGPRGGSKRVVVTENDALYGPDHNEDGKPHVLVEMYRTWMREYVTTCKVALEAGVDERRLRLEEAEVDQMFIATNRALQAAGLSVEQQEAFALAFAQELRQLG